MHQFFTVDREGSEKMKAILRIVGIGGGGCNAVQSMIKRGLSGVEFVAVNTDAQVLEKNGAHYKLQIGSKITKGLGAGADPNIGRKAAEEDRERIAEVLRGSDMVFLTAGMGGGTGTGAISVVASIAKSLDALVVAIVTKPFKWEGKLRMLNAEKGIQELKQYVDSLIVIPNERLITVIDKNFNMIQALDKANEVLYEATRGIADIINIEGYINVDFADVRSVMQGSGVALMGCGIASGENRAQEAAQKAISSPFLEGMNIRGAKSVLVNVTGSANLTMQEIYEGNEIIFKEAGEEVNVIFGCVQREEMNDYVSYTVIATGFDDKSSGAKTAKPATQKVDPIIPRINEPERIVKRPVLTKSEEEDSNTPSFFKLKTPSIELPANSGESIAPEESGFGFEKFKELPQQEEKKRELLRRPKEPEDDETSAFLRMIMD